MTTIDPETEIRAALYSVAPDIEGEPIAPNTRYRDQFEIDSMDFMRFIVELHRRTGVEIPELDYPQLETLAGGITYLQKHLSAG